MDPDRSFTMHVTMGSLSFSARVDDNGLSNESIHALRNVLDAMRGLALWTNRADTKCADQPERSRADQVWGSGQVREG